MRTCGSCGHGLGALGADPFCPSCGQPVADDDASTPPAPLSDETMVRPLDWRAATAERPAAADPGPAASPPPPPPPLDELPLVGGPRFPLFADEVGPGPTGPPPIPPSYAPAPVPPAPSDPQPHRSRWPWLIGVLVLLLVAAGGWMLLTSGDDPVKATDQASTPTPTRTATQEPSPSASASPKASRSPTRTRSPRPRPTEVAGDASVSAPDTAPPNEDASGNRVDFVAANMVDGVSETAWRTPGDGTGDTITLRLAQPTRITRVGLINGYAKSAQAPNGSTLDWYRGNRRVTGVEWILDDDTRVSQQLGETRSLQTTKVDPVTTSTVRLRLVSVSGPGEGRAARNYTPVSEISLMGTPARR